MRVRLPDFAGILALPAALLVSVAASGVPTARHGAAAGAARNSAVAVGTAGADAGVTRAPTPLRLSTREGLSGALKVIIALPGRRVRLPLERLGGVSWTPLRYAWRSSSGPAGAGATKRVLPGDSAALPGEPGEYTLWVAAAAGVLREPAVRALVEVPFARKHDGYLDGYHIGRYPTEGRVRHGRYAPPAGFIRVTPGMVDLPVSTHFRLGQFLTHDQANVWPKFLVLNPRLIDKLELVLAELNREGVPAHHMTIMSGYRTPQYNRRGLSRGRALLSRHQWGGAADVWVDDDGDGYIDDLNGDGRRDTGDVRVILRAVDAVERAHPSLRGGAGVYPATSAHGPFIHIDVRGRAARW